MTADPVAPLIDLAAQHSADLDDRWGHSSLRIDSDIDLPRLHALAALPNYSVTAYLGEDRISILVGEAPPDPRDLAAASALAPNERVQAEVTAATTGTEAVLLLQDQLLQVQVRYVRQGWARTTRAFLDAIASNWAAVAEHMPGDRAVIGAVELELLKIADARTAAGQPIVIPASPRPSGEAAIIWDTITSVADAVAWTTLAVAVRRSSEHVDMALHSDQEPIVPVTPETSSGGVALHNWAFSSDDPNREEALRFVFRLVTAAPPTRLPDARIVQKLAERQRIALTRDRAAEVHRAISAGHRDTADALKTAAGELSNLVEETTKTASATIVAVLGVVALVAENSDRLPAWLIAVTTAVAVLGVAAVVDSRWRRVTDQQTSIRRLLARLQEDPFLPREDLESARQTISDFNLDRRAKGARAKITTLGLSTAGVAVAAAVWLVQADTPASDHTTSTTTTTTSTSSTSPPPPATTAPTTATTTPSPTATTG
jgi:hypothetical protein